MPLGKAPNIKITPISSQVCDVGLNVEDNNHFHFIAFWKKSLVSLICVHKVISFPIESLYSEGFVVTWENVKLNLFLP